MIGLGPLSQSFVVQAVHTWTEAGRPGGSLSITVVDRDAEARVQALATRYPAFQRYNCVTGLSLDPGSDVFEEGAFLFDSKGAAAFTRAYVLLGDEPAALDAALGLLSALGGHRLPIFLAMEQENRLLQILRTREQASGARIELYAFGLLDRVLQPGLLLGTTTEILARAIHEEYVRDQERRGETAAANASIRPWGRLAEDLRESTRRQAEHIGSKLQQAQCFIAPRTDWDQPLFQFTPQEVEILARSEHQRYVAERGDGAEGKTWEEIDEPARELDRQAVRRLPALLARVGFSVQRQAAES